MQTTNPTSTLPLTSALIELIICQSQLGAGFVVRTTTGAHRPDQVARSMPWRTDSISGSSNHRNRRLKTIIRSLSSHHVQLLVESNERMHAWTTLSSNQSCICASSSKLLTKLGHKAADRPTRQKSTGGPNCIATGRPENIP